MKYRNCSLQLSTTEWQEENVGLISWSNQFSENWTDPEEKMNFNFPMTNFCWKWRTCFVPNEGCKVNVTWRSLLIDEATFSAELNELPVNSLRFRFHWIDVNTTRMMRQWTIWCCIHSILYYRWRVIDRRWELERFFFLFQVYPSLSPKIVALWRTSKRPLASPRHLIINSRRTSLHPSCYKST